MQFNFSHIIIGYFTGLLRNEIPHWHEKGSSYGAKHICGIFYYKAVAPNGAIIKNYLRKSELHPVF